MLRVVLKGKNFVPSRNVTSDFTDGKKVKPASRLLHSQAHAGSRLGAIGAWYANSGYKMHSGGPSTSAVPHLLSVALWKL